MNNEKKDIIFVLGMHRSSTSLTAMLLSQMGYYLGQDVELLAANSGNQKGYYEYVDALKLNDNILLKNGIFWGSIENKKCKLDKSHERKMQDILERLIKDSGKKDIVLKDPRICVLEPLWRKEIQLLDLNEKAIVVFRHPYEVAASLEKRDGMNFIYALKLWYFYNCSILECVYDIKEVLFLHHDKYFEDTNMQLNNLCDFLNISDCESYEKCIDVKLRHNQLTKIEKRINDSLSDKVLSLYNLLVKLSTQEVRLDKQDLDTIKRDCIEVTNTQYLLDGTDTVMYAFSKGNGVDLKAWSLYQLTNNDKLRKGIKKFFCARDISEIDIYGNGTLAKALYPILSDAGIDINHIYDRCCGEAVEIKEKKYNTQSLPKERAHDNAVILNTVLKQECEIEEELKNVYGENVFSLYRIICSII